MRILALECASVSASVAVADDGKCICSDFVKSGLTHSQTLMPMLQKIITDNNIDINSIDLYACTSGPGSFTGVRIGVSALKGLAEPKNKPCFAVSTLEAIAFPHRSFDGVVCAVMDARCNQVYTASFLEGIRLFDDEAILIDELLEKLKKLNKRVLFSGDGAELVYNRLKDTLNCELCEEAKRYPTAKSVAELTFEMLERGKKPINAGNLLPLYLRLPQAQRELNNKKLKGE